ncbi:MAG: hypothetical protein GY834_09085 [Bacteroidetes bacterium]|nr:hypothetical protein [Bacteroidota bacterium]
MKKVSVLIMILLLLKVSAYSQSMGIEVGLFAGGSYYLGDINPGVHFQQTRSAGGVIARYNIDMRWSVRMSALVGQVKAADEISQAVNNRDLAFESMITDISSVVEFNFFPFINGSPQNYMTPYIFGGTSIFFFNPKLNGEELKNYGTEGQNLRYENRFPYATWGFALPFGVGFKYSLTEKIGVAFEWGMRKTFTDYIDDISTTYYIPSDYFNSSFIEHRLSDPTSLHDIAEQRGNLKTMDWFNFFGISITVELDIIDRSTCIDLAGGYR